MRRFFMAFAALSAFIAVAAEAFAAHGLRDTRAAELLHTASRYGMWHALALLALCALGLSGLWMRLAAALMALGILLFSGSLYALALSGWEGLASITPFGGSAFLLGWLALAVHALSR
ncbi:MAG: DUF423 domain-containing protein [Gammaproteobacteria bacterium]|nr:MAG: DUF423 domain-containing protein [Gammaproteobacteria bacterium]